MKNIQTILKPNINAIENNMAWLLIAVLMGYLVASGGFAFVGLLVIIPFSVLFIHLLFKKPLLGLFVSLLLSFFVLGLGRYIKNIPFGLTVDGVLVLTYIIIFFKSFSNRQIWHIESKTVVWLTLVWFLYNLLQFFNPESLSRAAWFYAMRGTALYMMLIIPLVLLLFKTKKHILFFLILWGALSFLGSIKGIMQKHIGLDQAEMIWLEEGGKVTHLLFGKLRIFSFYSDAGQFGASQGHTGVVGLILFFLLKNKTLRFFFLIVSVAGFYGLMISGTRGAIAVPAAGFFLLIFLLKRWNLVIVMVIIMASIFWFFKYTNIGNSNYTINRMRTAFDPNDASLQARIENQRKLKSYLATRPFGGGIGSAGNWGQRFSPNGFLANVPTDSWFVMIWAEQGIVGLLLHIFILIAILIKGIWNSLKKLTNSFFRIVNTALTCGIFGIIVASYGNGVFGQMPTGIIVYISVALVFLMPVIEKNQKNNHKIKTIVI